MTRIVDSPLPDETERTTKLWFVLWKAIDTGRWHVWVDDQGDQAIADSEGDAEKLMADAKKFIDRKGRNGKLAAVGLRVCVSDAEGI